MKIQEFRQKYPQYEDLSDVELAAQLHAKHYSDMDRDQFFERFGVERVGAGEAAFLGAAQGATSSFGDDIAGAYISAQATEQHPIGSFMWQMDPTAERVMSQRDADALGKQAQQNIEQRVDDARADRPITTGASEIGGAVAGMAIPASKGLSAIKAIPKSAQGVAKLGAGVSAFAAEGAGYGALKAVGEGDDIATGARDGAVAGALSKIGMDAVSGALKPLLRDVSGVPNTKQLQSLKNQAYKAIDDTGIRYTPQQGRDLARGIREELQTLTYDQASDPRTRRVLARLESSIENDSLSIGELDRIRSMAKRFSSDPLEQEMLRRVSANIDEFVNGIEPQAVKNITAKEADGLVKRARSLNRRYRNAQRIEQDVVEAAADRAAVSGAGANIDNTLRQNVNRILKSDKTRRFFTTEEVRKMREISRGTFTRNTARLVGKAAPTGIVSGSLSGGVGYAALGPAGAVAVPAAGYAAKTYADRATKSAVDDLIRMIQAGSAEAAEGVPSKAGAAAERLKARERIVRALIGVSVVSGKSVSAEDNASGDKSVHE